MSVKILVLSFLVCAISISCSTDDGATAPINIPDYYHHSEPNGYGFSNSEEFSTDFANGNVLFRVASSGSVVSGAHITIGDRSYYFNVAEIRSIRFEHNGQYFIGYGLRAYFVIDEYDYFLTKHSISILLRNLQSGNYTTSSDLFNLSDNQLSLDFYDRENQLGAYLYDGSPVKIKFEDLESFSIEMAESDAFVYQAINDQEYSTYESTMSIYFNSNDLQ